MALRDKRRVVRPVGNHQDPQGFWQRMQAYLVWREMQNITPESVYKIEYLLTRFIIWCDERGVMRPGEVSLAVLERYQRYLYLFRKKMVPLWV